LSSDDEYSDSGSDFFSPPSLNRTTDDTVRFRTKAVSNSALRIQVCRLNDKLAATKRDLDQANEPHGSATNTIVSLKQDVVDLKAYDDVADKLELASGALVNTQDELACARNELEKSNETIRVASAEERDRALKKEHENLNLAMECIHSKVKARDDGVDRLAADITNLYLATQDKVLNDSEVAAMALDLVRMCH
jgi:hypothetical protein